MLNRVGIENLEAARRGPDASLKKRVNGQTRLSGHSLLDVTAMLRNLTNRQR